MGMYIRKTSRKNNDGSKITYLQLAHNVWDPDKGYARPQIIHNFGRTDELDFEALERLVRSICRFLNPEAVLLRVHAAGTDEVRLENSRAFGGPWLLDQLWQNLGIREVLEQLVAKREFRTSMERVIFPMVANRALDSRSKLGVDEWVREDGHIEGLGEFSCQQWYRVMDFILESAEEIQREVYWSVANFLNLQVDLIYFDATSTYFEIEDEDDDFRRRGYS